MEEEDSLQEESFQDGQPRRQPREAERRRIPAGIHSLEGGEFSVSVSQVPPVDPIRPHHLDDYIQSPRASPGGTMPQRASTSQRVEITPRRLSPDPSRASSGHQRPRSTLRVEPVQGSSQARLAFNNQPSESIEAASRSASPVYSPREDCLDSMRGGSPVFREQPKEAPWFSRQQGESLEGKMDAIFSLIERTLGPSGHQLPRNPIRTPHETPARSERALSRSSDRRERAPVTSPLIRNPSRPHENPTRNERAHSRSSGRRESAPVRPPLIRNPRRDPMETPVRRERAHSRSSERALVRSPMSRERSSVGRFRSPTREPEPVRAPLIRDRAPSRSPLRGERGPASRSPQERRYHGPAQRPPPVSPRVVVNPVFNPNIQMPAQQANGQGIVGEEIPQREEMLRRIIREEMAIARDPPEEEVPFGVRVASEPLTHQAILEQLSPFYPQIRRVRNSVTQRVSFEYVYDHSEQEGFWSVPKPRFYHPVTNVLDKYGYFGVLYTPTINKNWTFTTKPLMTEEQEEDPQVRKAAERTMDTLYKSAVPGRCADEEMENFLSSNPFADWRTQMHGQADGRYLSVDPDIFPSVPFIKWDAPTLLPSIEYKARLAAKDNFSAVDMLRAQNEKVKGLLLNWNNPVVWNRHSGVQKDEQGELVAAIEGMTLESTVSKEELLEEHHMRSRLIDLVLAQLVHQGKILVALESEVKLTVRDLFLFRQLKQGSNKVLLNALQNSRISVPELFGPLPESDKYKIGHNDKFDHLSPPSSFSISGPLHRKKFRKGPSGNGGSSSSARQSSSRTQDFGQQRFVIRQPRRPKRGRGPRYARGGGRAKTPQVSLPATRESTPSSRARPKGGRSTRGAGKRRT